MGIGPTVGFWLQDLHARGVFKDCDSIIELGPSQFQWPEKGLRRFLNKCFPDSEARNKLLDVVEIKDGYANQKVATGYYNMLGLSDYSSIDYGDGAATIKHDLNFEYVPDRSYDVCAELGTIEHVFNIGEGFRTVHNLVRPGGVMLHMLATFGGYFHGFYNTHSCTFKSLIQANNYEVIDLLYLHDSDRERMRVVNKLYAKYEDIRNSEARLQHVKFFADYFSSLVTGKERTHSHILGAFRKTSDAPFVFPHQINKYPIDNETQLWSAELRPQAPTRKDSQ